MGMETLWEPFGVPSTLCPVAASLVTGKGPKVSGPGVPFQAP